MKAFDLITALDEAKNGHMVAAAPSHAPTSGTDPTTTGQGKSEDEGETVKKAKPFPSGEKGEMVAEPPSHAPTSGSDPTTTGQGHSEDKGETVKKAIKDSVDAMLNGDLSATDFLSEGAHKAGCGCGFCKNKGSFGKKKKDGDAGTDDSGGSEAKDDGGGSDDDEVDEALVAEAKGKKKQAGIGKPAPGAQPKKAIKEAYPLSPGGADPGAAAPPRRIGDTDRMKWKQRLGARPASRPGLSRPRAPLGQAIRTMESVSDKPRNAIERMADKLLKSPKDA